MSSDRGVDRFMKRVYAQGEIYREAFVTLKKHGCAEEALANLLFATCTVAKFRTMRLADLHSYLDLVGLPDIADTHIKKLPDDLRSLADRIEKINKTPLAPQHDIILGSPTREKQAARDNLVQLYKTLPTLMRLYGNHFERFFDHANKSFRRLTNTHFVVLKFLFMVEEATGSPHYAEVANLLQAGYRAAHGCRSKIPRFFSFDGLSKLKQRNAASISS